ncbi:MAG: Uma2 family endonuclease, partial [Sphaerospermopsis sp.]|nr:Uma2 family endonuclease [Sphaerospermopsis sp.]
PMPELGLSLGLWEGTFRGIPKLWLRWFTLAGELIPEPSEEVAIAKQEANTAKIKAEKLAEKLRELGINPDELM